MSTAPSVLERLGYAPDARVVVVHADDIGMCHSANVGAFEALDGGVVSCGSLMVPCPWFAEAAQMARERPEIDLGVHLTLTSEWDVYRWGPVVGRDAVPSLCADDGCFYPTTEEVLAHATVEDVERELRAQIDKALAAGVDVTHLDSHMGTVFAPALLEVYARLMRAYELPGFMFRPNRNHLAEHEIPPELAPIHTAVDDLEADGFPVFDGFDSRSLGFEPGVGLPHNILRIQELERGLSYLVTHPALETEELAAMTADAHCRDFERRFYGSDAGLAAFADEDLQVIGMRPLRDLLRRGASAGSSDG